MEDKKPTEVEKVIEMWTAYKEMGLEGLKEVGRRRDAEWRAELEQRQTPGSPESGTREFRD